MAGEKRIMPNPYDYILVRLFGKEPSTQHFSALRCTDEHGSFSWLDDAGNQCGCYFFDLDKDG